jgi:hypothetical protein
VVVDSKLHAANELIRTTKESVEKLLNSGDVVLEVENHSDVIIYARVVKTDIAKWKMIITNEDGKQAGDVPLLDLKSPSNDSSAGRLSISFNIDASL